MTPPAQPSPRHPWLVLLRPANVVTAAADVLAGAAVAGLPRTPAVGWLVLASLCLYAGGVVLNDYFDRAVDRVERPERPIPSGQVSAATARNVGAALLIAGTALAAGASAGSFLVAGCLALSILGYDAASKRHAFAGPVNMGTCRALNLLLGMTIRPGALEQHAGLGLLPLVYIAGVTILSRGEVAGGKRPVALLALALVGAVAAAAACLALGSTQSVIWWASLLAALLALRVLPPYWTAWRDPSPGHIRAAVKRGVLSLVLLDAVIAASYADIMVSLAVLATAFLAGWLARLFAVT
ncbi:MAG: UbiA-like protein EboC [Acidobacteriota bacterium]